MLTKPKSELENWEIEKYNEWFEASKVEWAIEKEMTRSSMAGLICLWLGEPPSQAERVDDIVQLYTHEDPLIGERFLAEAYFMTFMKELHSGIFDLMLQRRKTTLEVFQESARKIVEERHGIITRNYSSE